MSQNIGKRWKNGNTKSYVRKKEECNFSLVALLLIWIVCGIVMLYRLMVPMVSDKPSARNLVPWQLQSLQSRP